jgi:hypothetical protein
MDIGFRSRLTTGLAAVSVGALMASPVTPGEAPTGYAWSAKPTVTLTAQAQTLPATTVAPQPVMAAVIAQQPALSPLDPVIEQVGFHVALLTNFVSTGAVLFGREFAIPGALLQGIHNGTSVPGALSQGLQTFAQIELQAGRDLVGFAAQYVSFQLNFLASLPAMVTLPLTATTARQATVALPTAVAAPRTKTVKATVSVGPTNHPRFDAGAGALHRPRHDHDGHSKSGGGSGS